MITEELVRKIFAPLDVGDVPTFFTHVAENVDWTVTGTENPLCGHYHSRDAALAKYAKELGPAQLVCEPLWSNVFINAGSSWVVVERKVHATSKRGKEYIGDECWICRFDEEKLVEIRLYMDSALVKKISEDAK
jgi:uncharacterized protein